MRQATRLAEDGYALAGYDYVNIDVRLSLMFVSSTLFYLFLLLTYDPVSNCTCSHDK